MHEGLRDTLCLALKRLDLIESERLCDQMVQDYHRIAELCAAAEKLAEQATKQTQESMLRNEVPRAAQPNPVQQAAWNNLTTSYPGPALPRGLSSAPAPRGYQDVQAGGGYPPAPPVLTQE